MYAVLNDIAIKPSVLLNKKDTTYRKDVTNHASEQLQYVCTVLLINVPGSFSFLLHATVTISKDELRLIGKGDIFLLGSALVRK